MSPKIQERYGHSNISKRRREATVTDVVQKRFQQTKGFRLRSIASKQFINMHPDNIIPLGGVESVRPRGETAEREECRIEMGKK